MYCNKEASNYVAKLSRSRNCCERKQGNFKKKKTKKRNRNKKQTNKKTLKKIPALCPQTVWNETWPHWSVIIQICSFFSLYIINYIPNSLIYYQPLAFVILKIIQPAHRLSSWPDFIRGCQKSEYKALCNDTYGFLLDRIGSVWSLSPIPRDTQYTPEGWVIYTLPINGTWTYISGVDTFLSQGIFSVV